MKAAVDAYVALRRVAGFALSNTEYLLHSFARFAHDRDEACRLAWWIVLVVLIWMRAFLC